MFHLFQHLDRLKILKILNVFYSIYKENLLFPSSYLCYVLFTDIFKLPKKLIIPENPFAIVFVLIIKITLTCKRGFPNGNGS